MKHGNYVLYAEDNPPDHLFFARAFGNLNTHHQLVHRETGTQIRDYLLDCLERDAPLPQLLVLDIKMPGLTGIDVLEFVRQHPQLSKLPVVLLSASDDQRDLIRAYDSRVNAYLVKPNRYHQLCQLVASLTTFWVSYNRVAL